MKCCRFLGLLLCMAMVPLLELAAAQQRSLDDWQLLYDHLRVQIYQDGLNKMPPGDKMKWGCDVYVRSLEVFAKDRDEAFQAAQEAQASQDPKVKAFFDKFIDLVEIAQGYGNSVLELAGFMLRVEDRFGPIPCETLCLRAESDGKCMYDNAKRLKFDHSITRGQVQQMLEKSLDDLEKGWSAPYGWYYPGGPSDPNPYADQYLPKGDKVRELAPYFELEPERKRADDLMNRYLKDALCLMTKGHQFYMDLAIKYKLEEARKYIEGFYATITGKVEVEEKAGRKPAPGASVVAQDPHDGKTWKARAGDDGTYHLKLPILHDRCSPFRISAEYAGARRDDTYDGPLKSPDSSYEYHKDFLFKREVWTGSIECSVMVMTDCNLESQTNMSRSVLDEHKEKTDYISINLEARGEASGMMGRLEATKASGTHRSSLLSYEEIFTEQHRTQCGPDNFETPGNWGRSRESWRGMSVCPIEKLPGLFIMPQGAQSSILPGRAKESSYPVKILFPFGDLCQGDYARDRTGEKTKVCHGERNADPPETVKGRMVIGQGAFSFEIEGTYTKSKDGREILTVPNWIKVTEERGGTWKDCPKAKRTDKCTLRLERGAK